MKYLRVCILAVWGLGLSAAWLHAEEAAQEAAPEATALPEHWDLMTEFKRPVEERMERTRKKFGEALLYEVDHEQRILYAVDLPPASLADVKARLAAFAQAARATLFDHGFDTYCTVVVQPRWSGGGGGGRFYPSYLSSQTTGPTLLHEFTHALHFADQEARGGQHHRVWIIEGLATLLESADVVDGKLVPRHTGRLYALRERLENNALLSWERMVALERRQFHSVHYAQAAYMLSYLQQQGKLKAWYDAYVEGYAGDPTGRQALEEVFGVPLEEIEQAWLAWVRELSPPAPRRPGALGLGVVTRQLADGPQITEVMAGSPAEAAGMAVDDVLFRVDGRRVVEQGELVEALLRHPGDRPVPVTVLRGDVLMVFEMTLAPLAVEIPPEA